MHFVPRLSRSWSMSPVPIHTLVDPEKVRGLLFGELKR